MRKLHEVIFWITPLIEALRGIIESDDPVASFIHAGTPEQTIIIVCAGSVIKFVWRTVKRIDQQCGWDE